MKTPWTLNGLAVVKDILHQLHSLGVSLKKNNDLNATLYQSFFKNLFLYFNLFFSVCVVVQMKHFKAFLG